MVHNHPYLFFFYSFSFINTASARFYLSVVFIIFGFYIFIVFFFFCGFWAKRYDLSLFIFLAFIYIEYSFTCSSCAKVFELSPYFPVCHTDFFFNFDPYLYIFKLFIKYTMQ